MIGGVYLAYPIDQRGPASLTYLFEQIERFKQSVISAGLAAWVFDPGDGFLVNQYARLDDSLPRVNRAALNNSDLVVAFLPAGVPSVGVPMEIDRARAQGKHVLVFSDAKSWMLELPGVMRMSDWQDESVALALEWVSRLEPPEIERAKVDLPVVTEDPEYMPTRAYPDDAGLDLYVSETTTIPPGAFRDVPCGISVSLPEWGWGLVTGRSSALRKRGLLVHTGIIDAGYRGPLFAGAFNLGAYDGGNHRAEVVVEEGERIAQLIVLNNSTRMVDPIQVEQLSPSARGTNGFGSSGT